MNPKESALSKGIATTLPEGITPDDLSLSTVDGFDRRYFKHLKTCRTSEEAYDKTADDYRRVFSRDRYASYDSYRISKSRRLKSNK